MRFWLIVCGIGTYLAISTSYANPTSTAKPNGKIYLDQSQDVYFEQLSANTFSLDLLQARNKFKTGDLIFGGSGEFDLQHWQGNNLLLSPTGTYQVGNGFYFTQATLDVMHNINDWSTVFLSVSDGQIGQGPPSGNNIYVAHGFVLFGNLEKNPVYFTLGINTIPFGVFTGSGVWDTPLTTDYFNPTQSPQLSLGFFKNNFNAVFTGYNDEINHNTHYVYSMNYSENTKTLNYSLGMGYLTHLKTNATGTPLNTPLRKGKNIPIFNMGNILDLNGSLGYGIFNLTLEYVLGAQPVGTNTGKPQALGSTLSVIPTLFGKETTFGLSYSKSIYLSNIPTTLPGQDTVSLVAAGIKNSWAASVSRPVINKNFSLGFDMERDVTYAGQKTYTYTIDFIGYL